MKPTPLLFLLFFLMNAKVQYAQGIKGIVKDKKGEPIGFVTIYCKEEKKGTNSNADGTFELHLPEGTHVVYFQSVGFKTKAVTVLVPSAAITVELEEQSYELKEVNIKSNDVNPAVWIMRKAIAAAPYYRRQILTYDARVYIKGSGRLDKIPVLADKFLAKEGYSEGQTFLIESINEVKFQQPNTFHEKAISIKSSVPNDGMPQPMSMIRGSLYETNSNELISPLSPQAFSVYTFKLEGSYYEDGKEVNRIKVTPKRKGDDVMSGYIYIMEGLWCLHSTDLISTGGGFKVHIVTSFRPVNGYDYVWMPVTYDIDAKGGMLGFKGSFRYLASVSDYKIKLNPNLDHGWVSKQTKGAPPVVAIEETTPSPVSKPSVTKTKRQQDIEALLAKEELTKLEMLRLANKMQKESEGTHAKEMEVKEDSSTMAVDSMALKRDSAFWLENRPVPLMVSEQVSYNQFDSIMTRKVEADAKVRAKDSTRHKGGRSFDYWGIVLGTNGTFNKKKNYYEWGGLLKKGELFVNTVDGWGASVQWRVGRKRDDGKNWEFQNRIRVPFERKAVNSYAVFEHWYNPGILGKYTFGGGSYISDFNSMGGPSPFVNSLFLLFDQRNLMKLYQQEYIQMSNQIELTNGLLWNITGGWYNRYALWNIDRYAKKETVDGKITPNEPVVGYLFPSHQALIVTNSFSYTPRQRYKMEKGRKKYIEEEWPTITLTATNGIVGLLSSDVDFMRAEVSITERIKPLHWLFVNARIGHQFFVFNHQSYFPDFNQLVGNRSPVFTGDALRVFRQLDYYNQSATTGITTLNAELDFKRLLVKRLPLMNMTGMREVIFYNGLFKPSTPTYQEVGYSLGNILHMMRVDVFAGFKNTTYNNWGVRLVLDIHFMTE